MSKQRVASLLAVVAIGVLGAVEDGKIGERNSYGNDPFPPRG